MAQITAGTQHKQTNDRNAAAKGASSPPATRKRPAKSRAATVNTRERVRNWLGISREQLDSLYRKASPGEIPQGDTRGTAIWAGGLFPRLLALVARPLAWQGKVFDLFGPGYENGVVVNKVSPAGLKLIVAKTYYDQSWMDGKPTIVIDYSTTSLLAGRIRDEIREVEPGLYLGKVWLGRRRILDFALETHTPEPAG